MMVLMVFVDGLWLELVNGLKLVSRMMGMFLG